MPVPQKDKLDRYRFQLVIPSGQRVNLSLGKVKQRYAERFGHYLDDLLASRRSGTSPSTEVLAWIGRLDSKTVRKLAKWDVLTGELQRRCEAGKTLAELVDEYIETVMGSKATKIVWRRSKTHLLAYFKPERLIKTITVGDAKNFRNWLLSKERPLSEATTRKTIGNCRQFFQLAIDHEWVEKNPFIHKDLPTSVRSNKARQVYVDQETTLKVIDACPNREWRLIVALARYAGLRCPSEFRPLTWDHIHWEQNRITVESPKTKRHEGKESRVIPIFASIRPYLEECFHAAPEGAKYVFPSLQDRAGKDGSINLRTRFEKIIKRAGVKQWPKLFHNLRASAQTDLTEIFPGHVACEWVGNSERIAKEHYLQVTNDHFATAASAETCARVVQSAKISSNQQFQQGSKTEVICNKKRSVITGEIPEITDQWAMRDSNSMSIRTVKPG